jgi:SAM-dependent methyltransferase
MRREQESTVASGPGTLIPKELSQDERLQREEFADELLVPGRDAPTFSIVNDLLSIGGIPWGDPLIPAYLLDKNYRIVDWNTAFGLAFDHSMDGRRGLSVLEWVYLLDNFEESLSQSAKDFADPNNLPRVHVENIFYTSPYYGEIVAKKRAYQVPDDAGQLLGWLVTLDAKMADQATTLRYKRDLFATLKREMIWSEYALSYDSVLLASSVYPELLNHVIGETVPAGGNGTLNRIGRGSRIVDVGAGSGNVARLLAQLKRGHVIFAIENNPGMLDLLNSKCAPYLRFDDNGPGILAIKQDAGMLFGLPEASFDYAILNNVAYALEDPVACFRQVRAALKPKGEIRVSGPQKSTNLDKLFSRFAEDLEAAGRTAELKDDFDRVREINQKALSSILYRWDVDNMSKLLQTAGFTQITYSTDSAYAGQAMIVAARK